MVWTRGPGPWALAVMLAFGCGGDSEGSSGGCGNSAQRCEINATATLCGDLITVECFDGAMPEAASQCDLALQQNDEAIYCCTSAAETTDPDGSGGFGGGAGSADGAAGQAGFGGAGS